MIGGQNRYPNPAPMAFPLGDVTVPHGEAAVLFRWMAPRKLTVQGAELFVRDIVSATGSPVLLQSWKNGVFIGESALVPGANRVSGDIPLAAHDLIELRVLYRGESSGDTRMIDGWVLFNA